MRLEQLLVIHAPLSAAPSPQVRDAYERLDAAMVPGAFYLGTCQRKVWVTSSALFEGATAGFESTVEILEGVDGYRFLLRVATGLESQVKGETDIFGQLKEAWKVYAASANAMDAGLSAELSPELSPHLSPWFQRLFEDTKEIRSQHLRNAGSDSYGSLVRKLLRKYAGAGPEEPILLIGAGQIAQSVAPWLVPQEVWIWNRSREAAEALKAQLLVKSGGRARVRVLTTSEEELEGWKRAAHAVVCIPADELGDAHRLASWSAGSAESPHPRALIHLGGVRSQVADWTKLDHFFALDDLFALQREQNDVRSDLFVRAERACDEKARLRSLAGSAAGSLSLPHGWEDLALF